MVHLNNVGARAFLKNLSEFTIKKLVSPEYFDRGYNYYLAKLVKNARFYPPNVLKAEVIGNYRPYYKVSIEIDENDEIDTDCSCPTGYFYCKHVIATLLTWINTPEKFKVLKQTDKRNEIIEPNNFNEIQKILLKFDKNTLCDKIIKILREAGKINDIIFTCELLNHDPECKNYVMRQIREIREEIPSIIMNIRDNYDELELFEEETGGYYGNWGEDEDLNEDRLIDKVKLEIEKLEKISNIFEILFRYELFQEAKQLYDVFEAELSEILDAPMQTGSNWGEDNGAHQEDYDGEIGDDYDDERDEFVGYEYVDTRELEKFRAKLQEKYLVLSSFKEDHIDFMKKILDFYTKKPSSYLKNVILTNYEIQDFSLFKNIISQRGTVPVEFHETFMEILSQHSPEEAISYGLQAIKKWPDENYFYSQTFELLVKKGEEKKALEILKKWYFKKRTDNSYSKLKKYSLMTDNWNEVFEEIKSKLKRNPETLFKILLREKKIKDAFDLHEKYKFSILETEKLADECFYNNYHEYALKLYKAVIKKYFVPGKGITSRLNTAVRFCDRIKQIYVKLNQPELYSSYLKTLETKYNKLRYFRTQFLEKLENF
ncbi:MAG: SWIM zinc finger family protein [Candidatus Helarchaeota archaeon]